MRTNNLARKIRQSLRAFLFILIAGVLLSGHAGVTVTKKARNAANTADITTATPGNTISYVVNYSADTPIISNITLQETTSADLRLLGLWNTPKLWNTTATGNTSIFKASEFALRAYASTQTVAITPTSTTSSSGGDGFIPILYHSADGSVNRFFEIFHHNSSGQINCQSMADGSTCSGYPKNLIDSTTGTAIGQPWFVKTVQRDGNLYFPAGLNQSSPSAGIGCFNMATGTSCAFIPLSTADSGSGDNRTPAGVVAAPDEPTKLFSFIGNTLYCHDIQTNLSCGTKILTSTTSNNDILAIDHYIFVGQSTSPATVYCWDATKNDTCSGTWPASVSSASFPTGYLMLHPLLNRNGKATGICLAGRADSGLNDASNTTQACWKLNGNTETNIPAIVNNIDYAMYVTALYWPGSPRVYYAVAGRNWASYGETRCWDFSKDAACVGFNDGTTGATDGVRKWGNINGYYTLDYGYVYENKCIFGLGHTGILWSFDPSTGNTPCAPDNSGALLIEDPNPFCGGGTHSIQWESVQILNYPSTLNTIKLSLYDADTCSVSDTSRCTAIPGYKDISSSRPTTAGATWTIQLSRKLDQTLHPSLVLGLKYEFANGVAPSFPTNYTARVTYSIDGSSNPQGQFCVSAKLQNCPAKYVDNLATLVDSDNNVLNRALARLDTGTTNPDFSDDSLAANSDGTLATPQNRIYKATYKRADWSGDLTAYPFSVATGVDEKHPAWNAAANTLLPAHGSRTIFTSTATGSGHATEFKYTTTIAALVFPPPGTQPDTMTQERIIDYLRGDQTYEVSLTGGIDRAFRARSNRLGDIVHSNPLYYEGYIYVQANDGMLHVFAVSNGEEKFAYIPSTILSKLPERALVSYAHKYFMDGQQVIVKDGTKTRLIASSGGDYPTLIGLNISSSGVFNSTTVLWESSPNGYLGRANGKIIATTLPGGTSPVALIGNGAASANNKAALLVIDPASGAITAVDTGEGSISAPNGLSEVSIIEDKTSTATSKLVRAYAGDLRGNLWRFDVDASGVWQTPVKLFASGTTRPISSAPAIGPKRSLGGTLGQMVYFGTGKPIDRNNRNFDPHASDETAIQAIYGIYDSDASSTTIASSDLVQQTITQIPGSGTIAKHRILSKNAVDYSSGKKGWFVELDSDAAGSVGTGERVVTAPRIDKKYPLVSTAIPALASCDNALVDGWLMSFDALTGGSPNTQVINPTYTATDNTDVYSGIPTHGTTAAFPAIRDGKSNINILSVGDPDSPGKPKFDVVKTRVGGTLVRNSWQEFFE